MLIKTYWMPSLFLMIVMMTTSCTYTENVHENWDEGYLHELSDSDQLEMDIKFSIKKSCKFSLIPTYRMTACTCVENVLLLLRWKPSFFIIIKQWTSTFHKVQNIGNVYSKSWFCAHPSFQWLEWLNYSVHHLNDRFN